MIVDHQTHTLHIYAEEDDSYLEHQGSIDLTRAGNRRIDYTAAPAE